MCIYCNCKVGGVATGVGAQSTLGGGGARHFCPKNMYEKFTKYKMPEFYMIHVRKKLAKYPNFMTFARRIKKIPEFYMIFAQKVPKFYIFIARNFFPEFCFCFIYFLFF